MHRSIRLLIAVVIGALAIAVPVMAQEVSMEKLPPSVVKPIFYSCWRFWGPLRG